MAETKKAVKSGVRRPGFGRACKGPTVSAPRVRDEVYTAYWYFAAERHAIFESRLQGQGWPWTDDPILQRHRFCNSFRAADRVTQHLIQHAIYEEQEFSEEDLFLRVVLNRLFSRPTTWDLLESRVGRIQAATFDAEKYDQVLEEARASGGKLYTGAFILCANSAYGFRRKHRNHLALLEAMLRGGAVGRVANAKSLRAVYEELLDWPLVGPFMAYQLATDLNYSPLVDFSENDFTVPGPGAVRGLAKVFVDLGQYSPSDVIHWLVDQQSRVEAELGITPPKLFGRPLHAIDCQNLLCEVDKYSRVAFPDLSSNRSRIKQRFQADESELRLFFPPKWGINDQIPSEKALDVPDPAPV